jgi:hypothetical protein
VKLSDKVLVVLHESLPAIGLCVLAVCIAFGQAKPPASGPAPTPLIQPPPATFSELANSRILIAYHKALEAQIQAGLAQQSAKDASDRYSAVVAAEVKAAGMPVGTQVNVQIATDSVTPVPPPAPAKEAEKPAAKK